MFDKLVHHMLTSDPMAYEKLMTLLRLTGWLSYESEANEEDKSEFLVRDEASSFILYHGLQTKLVGVVWETKHHPTKHQPTRLSDCTSTSASLILIILHEGVKPCRLHKLTFSGRMCPFEESASFSLVTLQRHPDCES